MSEYATKSSDLLARLDNLPFSKWHRNFFILGFLDIMFDAADFAIFGAALLPIAKEFGLGPAQAGLFATVGLIGAFAGAIFWGTISDYIGRRTAFQATIGIFAVFTGLIAASSVLVQAIAAVVGYAACGFLADRFGRRVVMFAYFAIGALFHLWFAEATGDWLYLAAAAVGWVNPGVFGVTSVYVAELHPTRLRATAVGWFFGIGRIGSFLAPAVIGAMLAGGLGHYVLHTFALSFLIAAIALWMVGVETKGLALESIHQLTTDPSSAISASATSYSSRS